MSGHIAAFLECFGHIGIHGGLYTTCQARLVRILVGRVLFAKADTDWVICLAFLNAIFAQYHETQNRSIQCSHIQKHSKYPSPLLNYTVKHNP